MAQTIVDILVSQNQDEMQNNKYGVQYSNDTMGMLSNIIQECQNNKKLTGHLTNLGKWYLKLDKIKGDDKKKDPQEIINYLGNVGATFSLNEIKQKFQNFSEQEIATIMAFQEEWDKFLEGINNANKLRKEKNNWQRIVGPICFFGGVAMSTAGLMLYLDKPIVPGYSVDVAKPVTVGNVNTGAGGTAVTNQAAVQPTITDIPTGSSNVGRGGSSESLMQQQNNIGYNASGTPDTTGVAGAHTNPSASGTSANGGGGHDLTGQQQLGMVLLIIGIIITLLASVFIYVEIQKQNEDENLPPVKPLKTPEDLQDKINQLAEMTKPNINFGNLQNDNGNGPQNLNGQPGSKTGGGNNQNQNNHQNGPQNVNGQIVSDTRSEHSYKSKKIR